MLKDHFKFRHILCKTVKSYFIYAYILKNQASWYIYEPWDVSCLFDNFLWELGCNCLTIRVLGLETRCTSFNWKIIKYLYLQMIFTFMRKIGTDFLSLSFFLCRSLLLPISLISSLPLIHTHTIMFIKKYFEKFLISSIHTCFVLNSLSFNWTAGF